MVLVLCAGSICLNLILLPHTAGQAVGDGETVNTNAIAKAVAAAAEASAMQVEVVVPAASASSSSSSSSSRYLTGAFSLASNVVLRIETGATLLASTNISDYPDDGWNWDPAVISTTGATNVGIVGGGTIDGQAPGRSNEGDLPTEILLEDTDGLHRPP